jgi:hypothetical protein
MPRLATKPVVQEVRRGTTAMILGLRPTHGDTRKVNVTRQAKAAPTLQNLMDIPAAVAGVYHLRPEEIKTTRARVYALNTDNAFGWKWRTMVEKGSGRTDTLLIWRIH